MNYINHITLTTGHYRKTYPSEVDKTLYFVLKNLYNDSLKQNGVTLMEKYIIKSTSTEHGAIISIFNKSNLPILTTAISNSDHTSYLWNLLHENTFTPLATSKNKMIDLPYIADRIEIGALSSPEVLSWTGDFSKCMGWIVLDPHKIM